MHDLMKKIKISYLICSYCEVNSAAVAVSFLIQGLFLLSDQTWKNSSIKICFFPYLEKYHFERWFICVVTWGDICHQVVTKQSFPGTRGDGTKSAAAEETEKMIEPESKPGSPQWKQGTELIKNPFSWCSVLQLLWLLCLKCHWLSWCSSGVWLLSLRSWLTLGSSLWEKDWVFHFQTLASCKWSIREEDHDVKFSGVAKNLE